MSPGTTVRFMPEIRTRAGRTVYYTVDGPADGVPLIMHNGTPGAALLYPPLVEAAARYHLRTVVYARPGYPGSTAVPGRTVADAVGDVEAVLEDLGGQQFVTLGWSGGGPHALACAALLPGRCLAAASGAGVAPYGADGLDWMAGMGAENVTEFGAALAGEAALTTYLASEAEALAGVRPADLVASLGDLLPEVDRQALVGGYADHLAESLRISVSEGIDGWRDDDLAFTRDWGFPLDRMTTPVAIWQGSEDRMVPHGHGRWLAGHIPGATAHFVDGEGHLSLLTTHIDLVLADLAGGASAT
jgi:pimeloyl-ACP methyl ester carboxylesterase